MNTSDKTAFSRARIRDQFPVRSDGLYLNHAAIAPWPVCAQQAVEAFAAENAATGPARYREWIARESALRTQLASLTGARSERDIALLKNTSEGISVVAWGLDWQAGDNVVLPAGEFPSNRLPWQAQAGRGLSVREVDIRQAENAEDALLAAMDDRTRLLSVSAVQWNDGFRLDLEKLGQTCRARGVLFFVDAIQQLGALPIDVERCRIDCLAADAHKWLLGPEGIAVFYCRDEVRPRLRLLQQGWHMADNPWNFERAEVRPSASARRFEAGSPNSLGQVALHASLELLLGAGMESVADQVLRNSRFLATELGRLPACVVTSRISPQRLSGAVSFRHRYVTSRKLHRLLADEGITTAVRGDSIRLSPHFYQDENDLARLIEVLAKI
jgi:selenocysteine lyase/cysteine desulfurase